MMESDFANRKCRVSVTGVIDKALFHAYKIFFQPFNVKKWLKFGLVLLVVGIGQGGSFNINMPFDDNRGADSAQMMGFFNWCESHLAAVIAIGAAILLVGLIIWILLVYLSSRFSFVFLDGVVNDDMRIREYYKANRVNGWSYFLWKIGFLVAFILILAIAAAPLVLTIVFLVKKGWLAWLIVSLVLSILFFIVMLFLLAFVGVLTEDFALPIMSLLKIRALKAWGVLWKLIRSDTRTFIYYLLMKFCLVLASLFLMLVPCCLVGAVFAVPSLMLVVLAVLATQVSAWLFIVIIPIGIIILALSSFLYNTIFAPVDVFSRAYSLLVLEGFGEEFKSINRVPAV